MVSVEQFGEFMSHPVPRPASPEMRKKALGRAAPKIMFIFGLAFLLLGGVFTILFFPWKIAAELSLSYGKTEEAKGTITRVKKTMMSVGGSRSGHGTPIYKCTFTFKTSGGASATGSCYTTGQRYKTGQGVNVEYLKDKAEISRIKGSRLNPAGLGSVFVVIFPLAGFGVLFLGWSIRKKTFRLLECGAFAQGVITNVVKTNMQVNNQTQYKITVVFNVNGVEQETTYNAYGKEVPLAEEKRDSGEMVGVIYDEANPKKVLLADKLIG